MPKVPKSAQSAQSAKKTGEARIRPFQADDAGRLVDIWLQGSLISHGFIDPGYWEAQTGEMASQYLPKADTYVLEDQESGKPLGFISLVESYIAALFVDVREQNRGYGKQLLSMAKDGHDLLSLKVYQQNKDAVRFYRKNGFVIVEETEDPGTSAKEYVMEWRSAAATGTPS
ncbi:hypothetical protein XI25_08010 [Paenibacillus sp. DMB20]|nr:hypothetical protein XI25_08010 [Paenibacillus sp. DMB20]